MVKENITTSELHGKKDGFVIRMSSELMAYLCNDYAYRNPNRFSRLKALQDLLIRYQEAKQSSSQMNVNIAQLAFVEQLEKLEVLEVCNMVTSKVVHLKPGLFSPALSPSDSM